MGNARKPIGRPITLSNVNVLPTTHPAYGMKVRPATREAIRQMRANASAAMAGNKSPTDPR